MESLEDLFDNPAGRAILGALDASENVSKAVDNATCTLRYKHFTSKYTDASGETKYRHANCPKANAYFAGRD